MTGRARGILLAALAALALPVAALAVQPSARLARTPEAYGLTYETVHPHAAGDSAALEGWWIAGPPHAPALVMAGPGAGNRADLLPLARAFHDRGLAVLLFDYRDFGPTGAGASDTLRDVLMASRWVDDAIGALRFARQRADSGAHVIGWGHDLGSTVMLAAAARDKRLAEGIVIDNPWHDSAAQMKWNGTSVIPDAVTHQTQLLLPSDEPYSAAVRVRVPVLLALAGREDSATPATADEVFRAAKVKVDRWLAPQAKLADLTSAPGYLDRVVQWVQYVSKWAAPR